MSGIYYVDVDEVLRAAGLTVSENQYNAGWQTRARSTGGFPSPPLGVAWHHTASDTSIENDLSWQCDGCDDNPVGNMTIDRDGVVWIVAAGASNCAGKGGPVALSRGTVPLDSGNTRLWNIEVANDGVGGRWPIAQINSYFVASNALNAMFGNLPTDIVSHALGSGDGWTDRKIDPAKASSVEGSWQPTSCNSSGTWLLADIRAECAARAGASPSEEDDMTPEQSAQLAHIEQTTNGLWEGQNATNTTLWDGDMSVIGRLDRVEHGQEGTNSTLWEGDQSVLARLERIEQSLAEEGR